VAPGEADIVGRADADGALAQPADGGRGAACPELAAMVAREDDRSEVVGQIAPCWSARGRRLGDRAPGIRRRAVPPARRHLAAGRALGLGTLPPALRLAIAFKISQCSFYRLLQTAEIVAHDPPDRVRVDTIGGVSKDVSETSDRLPRLLCRQRFGVPCNLRAASLMTRSACRTA
jgi:hypothetical protein